MPIIFGCETRETGEIYKQRADGLFGLGNSDASGAARAWVCQHAKLHFCVSASCLPLCRSSPLPNAPPRTAARPPPLQW